MSRVVPNGCPTTPVAQLQEIFVTFRNRLFIPLVVSDIKN